MSDGVTASAVFRAALDLQSFCEAQGWRFCIIGGIAVERWSVPRFTEDADMTVLTRFDDEPVLDALLSRYAPRRPEGAPESSAGFPARPPGRILGSDAVRWLRSQTRSTTGYFLWCLRHRGGEEFVVYAAASSVRRSPRANRIGRMWIASSACNASG